MRILFFGDVVGRTGRQAVVDHLPSLREKYRADFIVVNAENSAGGFGVTPEIANEIKRAGAHAVTTGNHVWDQDKIIPALNSDSALIRAANYPEGTPGRGMQEFALAKTGKRVAVLHLMGQVFMKENLDSPFVAADRALAAYNLGKNIDAIIVDFHAETASEKMALGHYLDGRVSLVVGTHTHVPTNDAQIMDAGTAYQTDAGMCGDYNSVIGFEKDAPLKQFLHKRKVRMKTASGEATVCGVFVETDDQTGKATKIEAFTIGGRLERRTT